MSSANPTDYDALLARADWFKPAESLTSDCPITQMAAAIRALRAAAMESEKDARRYRALVRAMFDDDAYARAIKDALRAMPNATTAEDFSAQVDAVIAAQEKAE